MLTATAPTGKPIGLPLLLLGRGVDPETQDSPQGALQRMLYLPGEVASPS